MVLNHKNLKPIHNVDERLVSFNIEMTEITGGTFWKKYTSGQIAGTEAFTVRGEIDDFTSMDDLVQYYSPIDLYNTKLRELTKRIGPSWIRISGSWATKTYYDLDDVTNGKVPDGYASVLTREQWIGVLNFVKAVNGKLLISVSNCEGDHINGGAYDLKQAKKIFDFSHNYGVDIDAVEFMNEPNMLEMSGAPKGYTALNYARDQDIFNAWVREHYPKCLLVGPCSLGEGALGKANVKSAGAGIGSMMNFCSTDDLMKNTRIPIDIFSYHYYNGVSERLASLMPEAHWSSDDAHSDAYLSVAPDNARTYVAFRDKYTSSSQMWVTESGDAGGGGNTWASTYLDVFRTLNELGSFTEITDGVIFHNTLASSDYGFLDRETLEPRPNYYAVCLWNELMGSIAYEIADKDEPTEHIFCHSRRDGKNGYVYLVINNSNEPFDVMLEKESVIYMLSSINGLRSSEICLNGTPIESPLIFDELKASAKRQSRGKAELPPYTCTFIVL